MNEAIAFDTLRFAKYLAKNGFTEQQAETMAEAQVRFLNANLATLATKADIALVQADIVQVQADLKTGLADMATKADLALVQADIVKVQADLKAGFAKVDADIAKAHVGLIKWMVGVGLALVAVQTTLLVGLLSWLL